MRRMFASRSSFEKPRPFDKFVRTSSPSRTSTLSPRARNSGTSLPASVVLPAPESPVNHRTNPLSSATLYFLLEKLAEPKLIQTGMDRIDRIKKDEPRIRDLKFQI